jgi:hypothetical protein
MAITNFIPTIWSENLASSLDKQYIAVAHCNREYEGEIREKGSTVRICGLGDVTVSDYIKNIDMSTPETLSDNVRELLIDQAKYFNFQIDDIDRAQSSPRLMEAAMKNVSAGCISPSIRDADLNGVHILKGDTIGILEKEIVVSEANRADAAHKLAEKMLEREINPKDHHAMIGSFLEEIGEDHGADQ